MAAIEIKNLCKRFRNRDKPGMFALLHPIMAFNLATKHVQAGLAVNPRNPGFAIENLNLSIPDGKIMVVLGPSGCGKSTLLRLISGLMPLDSGEVLYDGENVQNVAPGDRGIGMVFQNYALYPHFTSKRNILSYFIFKKKVIPEMNEEAQEKFQKTSELLGVELEYLLDRNPTQLSGGEKQRVALGRCITRDPKLFLLDEPFSNLDQPLRERYRMQLKKLLKHFNITTVYVTHDQHEALLLADVIAIMNIGTIEQVGTPEAIYKAPANTFVASFLNPDSETPPINWLEGQLVSGKLRGANGIIGIRPEDMTVSQEWSIGSLKGRLENIHHNPLKRTTVFTVAVDEEELVIQLPLQQDFRLEQDVFLTLHTYHLFDRDSGRRIQTYSPS